MHELSITQAILDLALEEARKVSANKVTKITLAVGGMTGIVPEYVEFYFEFVSKDTIAEGASLCFKRIPTQARCQECEHTFTLKAADWFCPHCQSSNLHLVAGNELHIETMEVS